MYERNHSNPHSSKQGPSSTIGRAPRFYSESSQPLPGPGRYCIKEKNENYIKFAISKRFPLFTAPDSPSPGDYNIPSCFDKGKSFTFSPKLSKSVPKYPGPGEYQIKNVVASARRPVFGTEKRKDNFLNLELVQVPGPGRYSHNKTLEGPSWKFGSEPSRKKQDIEDFPGPGAYEIKPMREKIVFKFPSGRKQIKPQIVPGPGQYIGHDLSTPKSPGFSMPRAEKFQKINGPVMPGPSDYFNSDEAKKSKLPQNNKSGNSMPTIHNSEFVYGK